MRHLSCVGMLLVSALTVLALSVPELQHYGGGLGLMWLGSLVLAIAEGSR